MSNNYVVRQLNEDDYDNYIKLIKDFRETQFSEEEFKKTLQTIKLNSDIYVIEHFQQLIATATIIYETKYIYNISCLAHIEDVCVKKEYRGKGFGKIIIDSLIEKARHKQCYKITLDCSNDNIGFYKKMNFELRGNQMSQLLN